MYTYLHKRKHTFIVVYVRACVRACVRAKHIEVLHFKFVQHAL